METMLSQLLLFGVLVFLFVGSGVLFWDGLALGFGHGRSGGAGVRLGRTRLVAGLLGVALTIWLAAGFLTRVH